MWISTRREEVAGGLPTRPWAAGFPISVQFRQKRASSPSNAGGALGVRMWRSHVRAPPRCLRSPVVVPFVRGAGSREFRCYFLLGNRGGSSPAMLVGPVGNRMWEIPTCGAPGGESGPVAYRWPGLRVELGIVCRLGSIPTGPTTEGFVIARRYPVRDSEPGNPARLGAPLRWPLALVLGLSSPVWPPRRSPRCEAGGRFAALA